jgi:HK97 family phage portal protein
VSLFGRRERRGAVNAADLISELQRRRMGSTGTAGQAVTERSAMQLMAVWRCRHLIADLVAGLPVEQFRQQGGQRVRVNQLAEFVRRPSDLVEPEEWRYQLVLDATGWGNGYAFVTQFGPDGWPRRAETVSATDVQVRQAGQFAPPTYLINGLPVDTDRVLHLRAYGPKAGSVMGMSPIAYAAQTIGLGLAVRDFGASWYESGGHPTTVLSTDQQITADQALDAKSKFRQATLGDHIAVMGNGWTMQSVQASPDDALFLAATNATAVDICGFFGIPSELLGYGPHGSSLTYANREQRTLDLLVYTLQWWVGRLEKLMSRQLPQPQFVKLNVDALLRSDASTRWGIHQIARNLGARSVDEIRAFEDEDPLPDGLGQSYTPPGSPAPPTAGGAT